MTYYIEKKNREEVFEMEETVYVNDQTSEEGSKMRIVRKMYSLFIGYFRIVTCSLLAHSQTAGTRIQAANQPAKQYML